MLAVMPPIVAHSGDGGQCHAGTPGRDLCR